MLNEKFKMKNEKPQIKIKKVAKLLNF